MKLKSFISRSEKYAVNFICALMILIMGFLTVESFMHSMKLSCTVKMFEGITYHHDNFFFNAIYIVAIILITSLLIPKLEKIPMKIQTLFMAAVTIIFGCIWVSSAEVSPVADQYSVINAASLAAENNFSFVSDRYFSNYPYQLGMVFYFEVLIRIFGKNQDNYIYLQIINVIHLALAYTGLSLIIGKIFESRRIRTMSMLTMIFSAPAIIYTTFLYGVIPGITYVIYAFIFEILYFREERKTKLIWGMLSVIFMTLAVMVKTNNYIALVALISMALVKFIKRLRISDIVYMLVMLVVSVNILSLTAKSYEKRSGLELGKGVPMTCYMAMGLDEPGGIHGCDAAGWYNSVHTSYLHEQCEFNADKTYEEAKKVVRERIRKFASDYNYTSDFFYEKNTSQWNEPTYASLWINVVMYDYGKKDYGKIANYVLGKGYSEVIDYMNIFQLFVYISSFAGIIVCIKKKDIFCTGLILIVLGGFLYHMIFEGKSQYIMPYFILLTGFSGVGICRLIDFTDSIIAKGKNKPAEKEIIMQKE